MKKQWLAGIIFCIWLAVFGSLSLAQSNDDCQTEVTVQVNDWLVKIAEKFYNDSSAYRDIVRATNAKATIDDSYPTIHNPNIIQPGWKLCLPNLNKAEEETNNSVTPSTANIEYLVTVDGSVEGTDLPTPITAGKLYQLSDAPQIRGEPFDNFIFPLSISGPVQLALARPLDSSGSILPLISTTNASSLNWILFVPDTDNIVEPDRWQEILVDYTNGSPPDMVIAERPVGQTIYFSNDVTTPQSSVASLFAAKDSFEAESGISLWIDFILIDDDNNLFTLYAFSFYPTAPAPGDEAKTFCCRWLGCSVPSQSCRFWGCSGICR